MVRLEIVMATIKRVYVRVVEPSIGHLGRINVTPPTVLSLIQTSQRLGELLVLLLPGLEILGEDRAALAVLDVEHPGTSAVEDLLTAWALDCVVRLMILYETMVSNMVTPMKCRGRVNNTVRT